VVLEDCARVLAGCDGVTADVLAGGTDFGGELLDRGTEVAVVWGERRAARGDE
jgi:hypothetical protein